MDRNHQAQYKNQQQDFLKAAIYEACQESKDTSRAGQ
jgi:hypothetical protein